MTAGHTRPLVAYLCVALAAALILVQGAFSPPPTVVPSVLGDAGGRTAEGVTLTAAFGEDLARDQIGRDSAPVKVGQPAGRQAADRAVFTPAPVPAASSVQPGSGSTVSAGLRRAGRSSAAPQRAHSAKPRPSAKASQAAQGKGNARGALRSGPRETRTSHRSSFRTTVTAVGGSGKSAGKSSAGKSKAGKSKAGKSKAGKAKGKSRAGKARNRGRGGPRR